MRYILCKEIYLDINLAYTELNKIKCKQSIIQFQWKCLHNIFYSEYRLQKMGKSNGQCHVSKNEI